ncbi:MAG: hypothetical protein PHX80_04785 [Candidatus Nanoarchaeia archaeon]|nr:hypothetical protein [Candidatus Nanoarchaeia archaeon]
MDFGFGESGGGSSYSPITDIGYLDFIALLGASGLTAGTFYKIADLGDKWIMFQALSTNQLAIDGLRCMICPSDYTAETDAYGNVWLGIWRSTLTPSAGDLVIWGGKVWENLTGAVGTSDGDYALDNVNWLVINKNSYSNHEYTEVILGCNFDFNTYIFLKQWDNKGNVVHYNVDGGIQGMNYTDWNCAGIEDNISYGIYNNIVPNISGNVLLYGAIINNDVTLLINNNIISNGDIRDNSGQGYISYNKVYSITDNTNVGDITNNHNSGSINGNAVGGNINLNSNNGAISDNTVAVLSVSYNTNNGEISGNSNTSVINSNSNNGDITSNSNIGNILLNANNGYIDSCESGTDACNIFSNINNGNISGTYAADVTDPIVDK